VTTSYRKSFDSEEWAYNIEDDKLSPIVLRYKGSVFRRRRLVKYGGETLYSQQSFLVLVSFGSFSTKSNQECLGGWPRKWLKRS
ncbi:hypothetical protein TorRG33x02_247810, partial [Trema orientale]